MPASPNGYARPIGLSARTLGLATAYCDGGDTGKGEDDAGKGKGKRADASLGP
jgi:hypothetical protein